MKIIYNSYFRYKKKTILTSFAMILFQRGKLQLVFPLNENSKKKKKNEKT